MDAVFIFLGASIFLVGYATGFCFAMKLEKMANKGDENNG